MRTYKIVIAQQLKIRDFNDNNPEHAKRLEDYLINVGKNNAPEMVDYPFKWFEAFYGWEFLAKFGRPSAMGLVQHDFMTVSNYVDRLKEAGKIEAKNTLTLIDQIITIDIEFVNAYSKKD